MADTTGTRLSRSFPVTFRVRSAAGPPKSTLRAKPRGNERARRTFYTLHGGAPNFFHTATTNVALRDRNARRSRFRDGGIFFPLFFPFLFLVFVFKRRAAFRSGRARAQLPLPFPRAAAPRFLLRVSSALGFDPRTV